MSAREGPRWRARARVSARLCSRDATRLTNARVRTFVVLILVHLDGAAELACDDRRAVDAHVDCSRDSRARCVLARQQLHAHLPGARAGRHERVQRDGVGVLRPKVSLRLAGGAIGGELGAPALAALLSDARVVRGPLLSCGRGLARRLLARRRRAQLGLARGVCLVLVVAMLSVALAAVLLRGGCLGIIGKLHDLRPRRCRVARRTPLRVRGDAADGHALAVGEPRDARRAARGRRANVVVRVELQSVPLAVVYHGARGSAARAARALWPPHGRGVLAKPNQPRARVSAMHRVFTELERLQEAGACLAKGAHATHVCDAAHGLMGGSWYEFLSRMKSSASGSYELRGDLVPWLVGPVPYSVAP